MDYEYPGTHVLRNKFNIMDENGLSKVERMMSLSRSIELREQGVTGQFDAEHLKSIHRYLFQDVYEWAGQFRDTYLARGNHAFVQPELIANRLDTLNSYLKRNAYFHGANAKSLANGLAYVLVNLNNIHPFREGNGRTQRMFVSQLALDAGYELSFGHMTEVQMRNASVAGYRGDNRLMCLHMLDGLVKLESSFGRDVSDLHVDANDGISAERSFN